MSSISSPHTSSQTVRLLEASGMPWSNNGWFISVLAFKKITRYTWGWKIQSGYGTTMLLKQKVVTGVEDAERNQI